MSAPHPRSVSPVQLILSEHSIKGWYSGMSIDSEETLAFSVLSGVRSMNEVLPLERVTEAYDRMMSGKARFRVVMTTGTDYGSGARADRRDVPEARRCANRAAYLIGNAGTSGPVRLFSTSGNEDHGVFIVLSGSIETWPAFRAVEDSVLRVLERGQFTGEVNQLSGRRSLVRCRAREASELVELAENVSARDHADGCGAG